MSNELYCQLSSMALSLYSEYWDVLSAVLESSIAVQLVLYCTVLSAVLDGSIAVQ